MEQTKKTKLPAKKTLVIVAAVLGVAAFASVLLYALFATFNAPTRADYQAFERNVGQITDRTTELSQASRAYTMAAVAAEGRAPEPREQALTQAENRFNALLDDNAESSVLRDPELKQAYDEFADSMKTVGAYYRTKAYGEAANESCPGIRNDVNRAIQDEEANLEEVDGQIAECKDLLGYLTDSEYQLARSFVDTISPYINEYAGVLEKYRSDELTAEQALDELDNIRDRERQEDTFFLSIVKLEGDQEEFKRPVNSSLQELQKLLDEAKAKLDEEA